MNEKTSEIHCKICNSTSVKTLPFGYFFNRKMLRGYECKLCSIRFIYPQPTTQEIKSLYEKDYFISDEKERRPHGKSDYFSSVESKREEKIYLRRLKEFNLYVSTGKLLEIGSGPGHFLNIASQNGWETTGIEISDFAAEFARKTFNLNVITGTIDEVSLPRNSFDVIFMGDLLEHVPQPKEMLMKLHNYLSDKGIIYIEIPAVTNGLFSRFGSFVLSLTGKTKTIQLPPYHLFEFTPKNIAKLLEKAGYSVLSIRQTTVSPWKIGLRDSLVINTFKLTFQIANSLLTAFTGEFGDRLTVVAKPL